MIYGCRRCGSRTVIVTVLDSPPDLEGHSIAEITCGEGHVITLPPGSTFDLHDLAVRDEPPAIPDGPPDWTPAEQARHRTELARAVGVQNRAGMWGRLKGRSASLCPTCGRVWRLPRRAQQ